MNVRRIRFTINRHLRSLKMMRKNRYVLLGFSLALIAVVPFTIWWMQNPGDARAGWLNDNWQYRKRIPLTNSSGSTVTDFQVQLTIDTAALVTAGKLQASCADLRFSAQGTDFLPYWIEPGTCNTTTTKIWTRVPEIPTTGANIWFYYGNPSAFDEANAESTFYKVINGVVGAWDMDDNVSGNGQTIIDTSGRNNNAVTIDGGGTALNCTVAGIFGRACHFDGTNDIIDLPIAGASNTQGSIAVWFYHDDTGSDLEYIFSHRHLSFNRIYLTIDSADALRTNLGSVSNVATGDTITPANWYQAIISWNNGNYAIYLNGQSTLEGTYTDLSSLSSEFCLGAYGGATTCSTVGASNYFDGLMDNARFYTYPIGLNEASNLFGSSAGSRHGYTTTNSPGIEYIRSYNTNVAAGSQASEETGPNPVAYWSFDEGSGQVVNDSSGKKNHGTLGANSSSSTDDPTWQSEDMCISGKCVKFDGSNDFVGLPDSDQSYVTVSAWFKANSVTAQQRIVSKWSAGASGRSFVLSADDGSANLLSFAVYTATGQTIVCDSSSTGGTYSANTWYHVTGVFNGTTCAIYLNGKDVTASAPTTSSTTIQSTSTAIRVGAEPAGSNFFNGFIDDIKIYPYARTAAEVKQDYLRGVASAGSGAALGVADTSYLNNGLVGYWKLDEVSGTSAADASGNTSTGTLTGSGTEWASGKYGSATNFDTSTDKISATLPSSLSNTTISYGAWVYYTAGLLGGQNRIIGAGDSWLLYLSNSAGVPTCYFGSGGTQTSGGLITTNGWTHVMCVKDAQGQYLYINGQQVASTAIQATFTASTGITIGNFSSAADAYRFSGKIDEARVYNRALSPAEVQDLYTWAPGPVGHWNFDEGDGQTAADSSGNNLGGTIVGTTQWVPGISGHALDFSDSSGIDYVTVPDNNLLDLTNSLTISAWVNLTDLASSDNGRVVAKNSAYAFQTRPTATGMIMTGSPVTNCSQDSTMVTVGEWHYITVTYDASNIKLYRDGTLIKTCAATGSYPVSTGVLTIGSTTGSGGDFNGKIDDVRVFNYPRSQEQILMDMKANRPAALGAQDSMPTPVAHWKFDDESGQTADDAIGSNNGTLGATSGSSTDDPTWKVTADGVCKQGGCLSFDGLDYVQNSALATSMGSNTEGSVSVWFKRSVASSNKPLVYIGDSGTVNHLFRLSFSGNTTIEVLLKTTTNVIQGSADIGSLATNNQWNHLLYTVNAQGNKLYLNGNPVNLTYTTGSAASTQWLDDITGEDMVAIGATVLTANFGYEGSLDEAKFWSTALNSDQVQYDYNQGSATLLAQNSSSATGTTEEAQDITTYTSNAAPIAEWSFDELDGQTVNDSSVNANNATLGENVSIASDDPSWTADCKYGGCLSFDGTSDTVARTKINLLSGNTLEAWVKTTSTDATASYTGNSAQTVFGDDTAAVWMTFGIHGGKTKYSHFVNPSWQSVTGTINVNDGNWHHIAVTHNQSTGAVSVYVDGKVDATGTITYNTVNPGVDHIGSSFLSGAGSSDFFEGSIDHVKIYNYARNASQIAYDYNRGKPIAHWKMDECQGNVIHSSSDTQILGTLYAPLAGTNTSIGTCDGSAGSVWADGSSGRYNSSIEVDGTDDYVAIDDNPVLDQYLSSGFSVSTWIKPGSDTGTARILSKSFFSGGIGVDSSWSLLIGTNDTFSFSVFSDGVNATNVTSSSTQQVGQWQHILTTYDGSNLKMYHDGRLVGTQAYSGGVHNGTQKLVFGKRGDGDNTQYFRGQIDDVKIFNYALSPAQVRKEYNAGGAIYFGN